MNDNNTSRYQIIKQIGEGGGGTVFLGTDNHLQKQVVLKKIKGSASMLNSRTEVDILKNLRHSYIPQVIDFLESEEGIYTVMDYIPGKSLQNMLDEGHKFTEKEVVKYATELCEALDYLHSLNPPLIHGDIKPDNIMVTPEGHICLIDFNISGFLEGNSLQTQGYTPGYSSPEQIEAFNCIVKALELKKVQKSLESSPKSAKQPVASQSQASYTGTEATVLLGGGTEPTVPLNNGTAATVLLNNDTDATVLLNNNPKVAAPEPAPQAPEKPSKNNDSSIDLKGLQISAPAIDARSDIFSVGATIYTLLTGKKLDVKARKHRLSNRISDGMRIVLAKCIEYKPKRRYQNAGELLEALQHIPEKSKAYRRLLRRQNLRVILCVIIISTAVVTMYRGKDKIQTEIEEKYTSYIEQLQAAGKRNLSLKEVDTLFDKAITIHEDSLEAYYSKASYLYDTLGNDGELDGVTAKDFLEVATETELKGDSKMHSNLYYLYADCLFAEEKYKEAADNYKTALFYNDDNSAVYRDYAISCIYIEEYDKAENILSQAVEKGVGEADIYLVRGELAKSRENYETAIEYFQNVVASTTDEYMLQRAYVLGSKCFAAIDTEEAIQQEIEWLNEAVKKLSMNNRILVYENLAQAYVSLGERTGDNEYFRAAIEAFNQILEMDWGSYVTYSNLIVLYQRLDDIEMAKKWADKMCDRYSDRYSSYMRRAFVEIEIQAEKPELERDYSDFISYYNQATEKYSKYQKNNQTDSEMLKLKDAYNQLLDGNWISQ